MYCVRYPYLTIYDDINISDPYLFLSFLKYTTQELPVYTWYDTVHILYIHVNTMSQSHRDYLGQLRWWWELGNHPHSWPHDNKYFQVGNYYTSARSIEEFAKSTWTVGEPWQRNVFVCDLPMDVNARPAVAAARKNDSAIVISHCCCWCRNMYYTHGYRS